MDSQQTLSPFLQSSSSNGHSGINCDPRAAAKRLQRPGRPVNPNLMKIKQNQVSVKTPIIDISVISRETLVLSRPIPLFV